MNSRQPSSEDGLETKVPSTCISISEPGMNGKTMSWSWKGSRKKYSQKVGTKGINMSDLDHFRQTTESFSEFWTELKRNFELARNKSTRCNDHKNCSACLDGYMEEELMSLIYNKVSDQRIRDCIDMLPDAEHTLEKYLHLHETQELSEANAAAFNHQPPTVPVHALRYKGKSQGKSTGKQCSSCGYKHKYAECKAKG